MDEREDTLICTDHEGGNRQDAWMSGLGGGRNKKGSTDVTRVEGRSLALEAWMEAPPETPSPSPSPSRAFT
jgi:hypothetical protein